MQRVSALACLACTYQSAVTSFEPRWLVAAVLFALPAAWGNSYWATPLPAPATLPWPPWRRLLVAFVPAWLLMAGTAVAVAFHLSPRLTIWIWLTGAGWLLAGAWWLSRGQEASRKPSAGGSTWACGLLVVAVAVALRVWSIDTVPRYVHCDEGTLTLIAQEFYRNPMRDWFAPPPKAGLYSQHMIFFYALQAAGTLLFGFNLVGARASDVLLGVASIALLFDGLRRVSGLRLATVAGLLLAANHCHVAYSRIASGYIQTAFFVTCAFALFARLWTAPSYLNAALLAVVMAMSLHSYQGTIIVFPLLLVSMLILLALHGEHRRRLRVPMLVFVLSCASGAAVYGAAFWQHRDEMVGRAQELNILSERTMSSLKRDVYHTDSATAVVAHQAWNALRGFHVGGDHQPQYGIDLPMADPYTAALMVPGAMLVLLAFRDFVAVNAAVFTLAYLLLGLGMQWAPGFNRTTGALPLGMLIAAIALVQCVETLWAGPRRWSRWAANLSLAAGVALCVVTNLRIYFVHYGAARVVGDGPSEAGWVAREYAGQYTVHLVDWPLPGEEGIRLILGSLPVQLHDDKDSVHYVRTAEVTGSDLFILYDQDKAARDALLARFPGARVESRRRHPIHGPTLILLFVGSPRGAANAAD